MRTRATTASEYARTESPVCIGFARTVLARVRQAVPPRRPARPSRRRFDTLAVRILYFVKWIAPPPLRVPVPRGQVRQRALRPRPRDLTGSRIDDADLVRRPPPLPPIDRYDATIYYRFSRDIARTTPSSGPRATRRIADDVFRTDGRRIEKEKTSNNTGAKS